MYKNCKSAKRIPRAKINWRAAAKALLVMIERREVENNPAIGQSIERTIRREAGLPGVSPAGKNVVSISCGKKGS